MNNCQTFPLPTEVAVCDLVFHKRTCFPHSYMQKGNKKNCTKIWKELLVGNSRKIPKLQDFKR